MFDRCYFPFRCGFQALSHRLLHPPSLGRPRSDEPARVQALEVCASEVRNQTGQGVHRSEQEILQDSEGERFCIRRSTFDVYIFDVNGEFYVASDLYMYTV